MRSPNAGEDFFEEGTGKSLKLNSSWLLALGRRTKFDLLFLAFINTVYILELSLCPRHGAQVRCCASGALETYVTTLLGLKDVLSTNAASIHQV